ncbi:helix-turn-helix domain-containing protein [Paenibacillus alkalitolerans]|uniref:helix-turn-helix domain-containing protein n=1 Tax=Paenibacillus alkalitolerans TaxID=2799335 RepID=UPI0018F6C5A1|nr:AraC family transcriptional regulator [Paenibacillus alkalitolerans]
MTYAPPSGRERTELPDKTFPINVFTVCEPKSPSIPPHWHEHLEWMYIRRGSYRVQVDSLFEDVVEGDIVFVNSRRIHAAFPLGKQTELTAIVFNEAVIRNSALDSTEKKYILPIINNECIVPAIFKAGGFATTCIEESLIRLMREFEHKQDGYELFVKAELLLCLGHVYRSAESGDERRKNRPEREGAISPVLRHLTERFHEALTVDEAAQMCSLSPNYFCNLFKKTTGKTFIEYVNMLRIIEADRLLRETDCSINEVAYRVGFSNLTYFGRVFKKLKNVSPSDLRRQLIT